jgi:hypothetical protein
MVPVTAAGCAKGFTGVRVSEAFAAYVVLVPFLLVECTSVSCFPLASVSFV